MPSSIAAPFSILDARPGPPTGLKIELMSPRILTLDSSSPTVSVAVGTPGEVWASDTIPQGPPSRLLIRMIHDVLARTDLKLGDLDGLVGVRGPGSFTGIRVGLATLMGIHQSLGIPATAVSTFRALAAAESEHDGPRLAAVSATRAEWLTQAFDGDQPSQPLGEPARIEASELSQQGVDTVVGFNLPEELADELQIVTPTNLATTVLTRLATHLEWESGKLAEAIYLASPVRQ